MLARTTVISLSTVVFTAAAVALAVGSGHAQSRPEPQIREIEISVENGRYSPARITVTQGERVRLKFVRKEHNRCTEQVVFPALSIERELPPNQPVYVDLRQLEAGETAFHCGMNMVKGTVFVEARN